jgi:hypothetical protein
MQSALRGFSVLGRSHGRGVTGSHVSASLDMCPSHSLIASDWPAKQCLRRHEGGQQ